MYFVSCTKEDKVRTVQEVISALMKRNGADMRDAVNADAKEARTDFTKVVNSAVEEAVLKVKFESELSRSRYVKESARVAEDNYCRRRDHEEEKTSSSVQSSVTNELLSVSAKKAEGEILRAIKEAISSLDADKDRDMDEELERAIA